jgi:enamine deaminase RidA (YjgF/YER057c/UK114 family)
MSSIVTFAQSGLEAASSTLSQTAKKPASPASLVEMCLTLRPRPGEGLIGLFNHVADALEGATIASMLAYGPVRASGAASEAMRRILGKVDWPVTWVDGGACDNGCIAGVQIFAVIGGPVARLRLDGVVLGSVYQDADARHCLLGGLGPDSKLASPPDQTKQTIEKLQSVLAQAGFSMADIIRTWYFLDDILPWYAEFNRARMEAYSGVKFRAGSLPASTGVGARNQEGAALAVAGRAMQPLNGAAPAVEVASPLQCPAPCYGSSFSRAMEISTGGRRQLFVSGTASIAPGGETLWQSDVRRQVDLSMDVIEAILRSRGMSFADVTRAVAYFKRPTDARAFTEWRAERKLASLRALPARCDICRDDLLFELELDAAKVGPDLNKKSS